MSARRWPARAASAVAAGAALCAGLAITAAIVNGQQVSAVSEARIRFEQHAERLQADISKRFNQVVYGLKGARGVYAATHHRVDRAAFRAYVESRDLPLEFPGVRGFGFAQRVPRDDLDRFVRAERADDAPHFAVHTSGQAADLFIVKYIEPLSANYPAWGFDLGSEAVRREAIERAIDTGEPTLSGRLTLVQDKRQGPGFLYLVPVFRDGADPATPQQRRAAMMGVLYAPIAAAEVLHSAAGQEGGAVTFRLAVLAADGARVPVFDSEGDRAAVRPPDAAAFDAARSFRDARTFAVGSRAFLLDVASTPGFDSSVDWSTSRWLGLGGTLLSLMLAVTVWLLVAGRARAVALAEAMTVDLDRLAKVARRTSNAVVITDVRRRITWVNEGFTRITGYTADEALGRAPGALLQSAQTDPGTVQRIREALQGGSGCQVELRNRHKDGRHYWLDIEIQPLRDAHGTLTGFMAIESDITARKDAEAALAQERNRLSNILESQTEFICRFRADGVMVFVNDAFCRFFGTEAGAILGRTWAPVVFPADLAHVVAALATMTPQRPTVTIENRVLAAGGVLRWAQFVNCGFFDDAGRLIETQSVGRDVSERKALEAEVADVTQSLQDLYDNAPCGYYALDAAGRYLRTNALTLRWLGCTREALIGRMGPCDFFTEEGQALFRRTYPAFMADGRIDGMEFDLLGRDGSVRRVSVSATAVRDGSGAFLRSRCVMFDITETHRIRQQLHQLNLEQDRMLDNDLVGIVKLRDRVAVWKNRALERLFGYGPGELLGQSARLLYPDDATYAALGAAAHPNLTQGRHYRTQLQMRRKGGELIWIDLSGVMLPGDAGEAGESLWMMVDITQIKTYQAQVERAAFHDALTDLPNRTLLSDRLRQALGVAARGQHGVAVCYLDLDGFKHVNDTHGHDAGDAVLRAVARRLLSGIRPGDTVARLGGDEFVVVLAPAPDAEQCLLVLQRLLADLVRPIVLDSGAAVGVGSSIGVACYPADGSAIDDLLARADRAMFESKRAGRCGIRFHGAAPVPVPRAESLGEIAAAA